MTSTPSHDHSHETHNRTIKRICDVTEAKFGIRVNEIGFEGGWSIIVYRENGGSWMRMTSTKYVPLKV